MKDTECSEKPPSPLQEKLAGNVTPKTRRTSLTLSGITNGSKLLTGSIVGFFRRTRSASVDQGWKSGQDKGSTKNIYRQPTKTKNHTRKDISMAELKRRQFAQQHLDWHSDPDDIYEQEYTDLFDQPENSTLGDANDNVCDIPCRRTKSLSAIPNSILKRGKQTNNLDYNVNETDETEDSDRNSFGDNGNELERPEMRKQTSFKEDVDVFYYDNQEHMKTKRHLEKLRDKRKRGQSLGESEEDDEDDVFTTNTLCDDNKEAGISSEADISQVPSPSDFSCSAEKRLSRTSLDSLGLPSTPTESKKLFELLPDHLGYCNRRLRVVVYLEDDTIKRNTSVKALSNGAVVLIVTYKFEQSSDELRQCIERLALPVQIDPCRVKARVVKNQYLVLEAPVIAYPSNDHGNAITIRTVNPKHR